MMDWGKIVESAIGTLMGGGVAIASMWIKEIVDRRKATQAWYEQYYITEGIDRVMGYVRIRELQLIVLTASRHAVALMGQELKPGIESLPKNDTGEVFPLDALVRVENLLNDSELSAVITPLAGEVELLKNTTPSSRSMALLAASVGKLKSLSGSLKEIREDLLKVKIKQKSDIKNIRNRDGIKKSLATLKQSNNEWLAKTSDRDSQISRGL